MTRRIYLLRHAKSDHDGGLPDHARPLNARGRGAAARIGEYMSSAGINPTLILCSSSVRTRETLEGVVGGFAEVPEISLEDALYNASAGEMLSRLQDVEDRVESVMLIGHQPGIQQLAVSLAGEGDQDELYRLAVQYPTAALTDFTFEGEWQDLAPQSCRLEAFVLPREIES